MKFQRNIEFGFITASFLFLFLTAGPAAAEIETLYVIQHSHADVGFDAPPSVMFQRNHDRTVAALDLADQYPDFRWTVETSYQLEGFLENATQQNLDRLKDRLAEERFTFGANYTNLHSGLCGQREFETLLLPGEGFAAQLGAEPNTVLLNDVPGFTVAMPRLPPACRTRSWVRTTSSGANRTSR